MNRASKQGIIALLLFGMLVGVVLQGTPSSTQNKWRRWLGQSSDHDSASLSDGDALTRYGFKLREVAHERGIDFQHSPASLDAKLAHIMPLVNAMGAAATVIDFNADGWMDLYVVTSKENGRNALYRNRGDGTFDECASAMGVAELNKPGTGVCMGSIAADYDNDGFTDLFIYKWGRPELFQNRQGAGFERMTESAGLPEWSNANAACWLDYDLDGRLDLFIAGYWSEKIDLWNLTTTDIMPESFEYAKNGGRKHLLHNMGNGRFEDTTAAMGIKSTRWTLGVVAANLCGSGYPDLVLANDYGVSELYANRDGQSFEEVGDETGVGKSPKSGMSVSIGDVFNQEQKALYVTNITEPGNLVQGNNLWVPIAEAGSSIPHYLNQAAAVNIERGGWSWGAKFGDLNNDGWLDLFLTNGYISANKGKSYWYDYGKIAGGLKGLIREAKYWPPIGDQSLAGYQTSCLWLNKNGYFADIATAVGVRENFDGRAVALGDFANRGALDVIVANQNGPILFYQNTVDAQRDWIQFELIGGSRPQAEKGWTNRSAIGAEVTVAWRQDGSALNKQTQVVTAGDAYASQSTLRLHFGLGAKAEVESVETKWPSGRKQRLTSPQVGALNRIEEAQTEVTK